MAQNPKPGKNAKTPFSSLADLLYPAGLTASFPPQDDGQDDQEDDQGQDDQAQNDQEQTASSQNNGAGNNNEGNTSYVRMANTLYGTNSKAPSNVVRQVSNHLQSQDDAGPQDNNGITTPGAPNTSANAQPGNMQNAPHDVTAGDTVRPEEKAGQPIVSDVHEAMKQFDKYYFENFGELDPYSTNPYEIARNKNYQIFRPKLEALMLGLRKSNLAVNSKQLFLDGLSPLTSWVTHSLDPNDDAFQVRPEWQPAYEQGLKLTQRAQNVLNQLKQNDPFKPEPGSAQAKSVAQFYADVKDGATRYLLQSPNKSDKDLTYHVNDNYLAKWIDGPDNPFKLSDKAPELPGDASAEDINIDGDNYYLVTQTPRQLYGDDQALKARALKDPGSLGVTPVQLDGETVYLPKGKGDNDAYLDRTDHDAIKKFSDKVGNSRDALAVGGAASAEFPPLAAVAEGGAGTLELLKLILDGVALSKSEHPVGEAASMAAGQALNKLGKYTVKGLGIGENHPGKEKLLSTIVESGADKAGEGLTSMVTDDLSHHRLSASEQARLDKRGEDLGEYHRKAHKRAR